jgi:hypothetical protein
VDEWLVRESGIVQDMRVWLDDAVGDPAEQTVEALEELGLVRGKRVGGGEKEPCAAAILL